MCEKTDENVQRLRELHPEAPLPACPAPAELPMSIEITTEMVESALRSFPAVSAAGPSGLRAHHMMDAFAPAHRGTVLEQLAAALQVAVRGEAPEAVAPYMDSATLLGLVKDGGGVRPIAIGEVLRRLAGKVLCKAVREAAREYFEPVQVGVGAPLWVDGTIHTARGFMERGGPNKSMLKMNFGNAFNRVSREPALREVRERFPEVARWTQCCYTKPSVLQLGNHSLWSAAGVQQGDPLGPLLFAAALHPMVSGLSDLTVDGASLDMNACFLDDGFLADLPVVAAALQRLLAEAAERGLEFNLANCTLVLPADAAQQDLPALFPADLLCDPTSGEPRVSTGRDFDTLKAAIGDQAHCEAFAEDRVTAAGKLMRLFTGHR